MHGEFYTERDIVDMLRKGVRQLALNEGDRMTALARERAAKEGLKIIGPNQAAPEQAAREAAATRYAAQGQGEAPLAQSGPSGTRPDSDLHQRVRKAVIAKLGDDVDTPLLDDIIGRVLRQVGR